VGPSLEPVVLTGAPLVELIVAAARTADDHGRNRGQAVRPYV
jgi:hypothetical protein